MIKIRQSGLGLLEAILALGIMGIIMAGLMGMVNSYLNDTRNQIVANQSAQVMACAQQWISSNYSTVTAAATPIDTYSIPISSLIASGCLPTGFSTTNGFGQAYNIFALEPSASAVQAIMVTTGGTPINDVDAAAIASASKGGAVYSTAAGTLKGAMGNYAIPLAAFGIPPGVPGAGHVGWALWFGANGQIISDYLYRSAVPGHPEANRMSVALDMNGNVISGVPTLEFNSAQIVGAACSAGTIGRDSAGAVLSCQGGVWKSAADGIPAGTITSFAMQTPPNGWLEANGQAVSRFQYAALFAAIGTSFGSGDGFTTFNLPDTRGMFVRGWDNSRGIDAGRSFGSDQQDSFKSHSHTTSTASTAGFPGGQGTSWVVWAGGPVPTNTNTSGENETRPRNIALLYCIKY